MRWLKTYKVFENNAPLKAEIGDYLQDLTDAGIEWMIKEVGEVRGRTGERLQIMLTGRKKIGNLKTWQNITWGAVSSSVFSVIDFLESSGWKFTSLDGNLSDDENIEIFSREEVGLIDTQSLWGVMIFDFKKVPVQLKESLNDFREIISGLKDYCEDFYPLKYRLFPDFEDSIGLNLIRLHWEKKIDQKKDFYLIIEVTSDVMEKDTRTREWHLGEGFILTCRQIESWMAQWGFKTLVSVKYPVTMDRPFKTLDTIDELGEVLGTINRVMLEFVLPSPIENMRYL